MGIQPTIEPFGVDVEFVGTALLGPGAHCGGGRVRPATTLQCIPTCQNHAAGMRTALPRMGVVASSWQLAGVQWSLVEAGGLQFAARSSARWLAFCRALHGPQPNRVRRNPSSIRRLRPASAPTLCCAHAVLMLCWTVLPLAAAGGRRPRGAGGCGDRRHRPQQAQPHPGGGGRGAEPRGAPNLVSIGPSFGPSGVR